MPTDSFRVPHTIVLRSHYLGLYFYYWFYSCRFS